MVRVPCKPLIVVAPAWLAHTQTLAACSLSDIGGCRLVVFSHVLSLHVAVLKSLGARKWEERWRPS